MTDHEAHALDVLDGTCYAVLATADASGNPWVTPVWFAHHALDALYWLSCPDARHSQLIAARPQIAVTVFDSHATPNQGSGFYAVAQAGLCPDERIESALDIVNRRSVAQGIGAFTREGTTDPSRLRLYLATITESWVLDPDAATDQRARLSR